MKTLTISQAALSEFIKRANDELYAEYAYRALANYMHLIGFFGAAEFFLKESKNEAEHYQKIVNFANDCGGFISLSIITPISKQINTLSEAVDFAYQMERDLQEKYEAMANRFVNEHTVYQRVLFYVKEQRKSVGEFGDIKARIELCKNDTGALLQIDHELKKR